MTDGVTTAATNIILTSIIIHMAFLLQAGSYGGHNGEHYGAHVEEHYGPSDKSYGYKDGAYRHKIGRHGFHEGNHYDDVGSQKGKNEKSSEKYFAHVLWKVHYLKVPLYKI